MFVRLTKSARLRSGWLVALLYLFCVLAPGAALALGDAASCLTIETPAVAHDHEAVLPAHAHHRPRQLTMRMMTTRPVTPDIGMATNGAPDPCCAMLCVSAIAADPPSVARPVPPISLCVSEDFQRLPGEAPPLLYRPPIA